MTAIVVPAAAAAAGNHIMMIVEVENVEPHLELDEVTTVITEAALSIVLPTTTTVRVPRAVPVGIHLLLREMTTTEAEPRVPVQLAGMDLHLLEAAAVSVTIGTHREHGGLLLDHHRVCHLQAPARHLILH